MQGGGLFLIWRSHIICKATSHAARHTLHRGGLYVSEMFSSRLVVAFGFGLMVGRWLDSWFLCCFGGLILMGLGVCVMRKR